MRITVEVDDALLAEVKAFTGCKTDEDTIRYALRNMSEHPWMKDYYRSDSRLRPEDLVDILYPDYDPRALWGRMPDHPRSPELSAAPRHETAHPA